MRRRGWRRLAQPVLALRALADDPVDARVPAVGGLRLVEPVVGILVFRALQGLFGGGLQPTQQSIILDHFPPEKRQQAFSLTAIAIIIAPVGATPAYPHDTLKVTVRGSTMGTFRAFSYAQAFNVFDLPVVTVPAGRSRDGLPIGVQVVGLPFAEEMVLAVTEIIESTDYADYTDSNV